MTKLKKFQERSFHPEVFYEEVVKAFRSKKIEDSSIIQLTEDELTKTMLIIRLGNGETEAVNWAPLKHQIKTNRASFMACADSGGTPIIPHRNEGGTIVYLTMYYKNSLTEKERLDYYIDIAAEDKYKAEQAKSFIGAHNRFHEHAIDLGVPPEQLSLTA